MTLFMMVKCPHGISLGLAAGMGAAASLLLGTVSLSDAAAAFVDIWDAALAFIGIVTLSVVLDAIGFFKWAAMKVVKLTVGSGLKLYFYVALLTACTSILFANDSAVLILTPIVLEVISQLKIDDNGRLAYLFSAGLIADTAAMPLITSNPVNIVSADFFKYSFVDHIIFMGLVAVVTIISSLLLVYLYFRKKIPKTYSIQLVNTLITGQLIEPKLLKISIATLAAIDVGYVVASLYRLPVSMVICSGSIFLLAVYQLTQKRPTIKEERRGIGSLAVEINWDIVSSWWASAMNNWPITILSLLSIKQAASITNLNSQHLTSLIFSNIIGNNLGPHFFPLGSLAILMWLETMKRKGVKIRLIDYLKVGSALSS
ncbi:MAG: ArsB/NhaD family transporter [Candidatus Bathycorpusculaceae bacterium]